jgi:hypothetical protein
MGLHELNNEPKMDHFAEVTAGNFWHSFSSKSVLLLYPAQSMTKQALFELIIALTRRLGEVK